MWKETMQTKEEVARAIPLWQSTQDIAELHKEIIEHCNYLQHEINSPIKQNIAKLKALFIIGTNVFLAQYRMFWKTVGQHHPLTKADMYARVPEIEARLRCMLDFSQAADYNSQCQDKNYTVYLVLSHNFLYLSSIFICPYFNFLYSFGVINQALLQEYCSNNTPNKPACEDVVRINAQVQTQYSDSTSTQTTPNPAYTENPSYEVDRPAESASPLEATALTEGVPEQPKSWASVVGGFLNPDTVPGVSPEKSVKKVVGQAPGSEEIMSPTRAVPVEVMAVANTLGPEEKQVYLADVEANVAKVAESDEEEELPVSRKHTKAVEVDADGFRKVKRRNNIHSRAKRKQPYLEEETVLSTLDSKDQEEVEEEEGDTLSPFAASHEEGSPTLEEQEVEEESLPSISTALDRETASTASKQKETKKRKKKLIKKPVNPVEELKSALDAKKFNKWNDKYLGHEVVAAELDSHVIQKVSEFSSADVISFVERAKLPVKILLCILRSDGSDLSVRKTAFEKLLTSDDFVGLYLHIEQKKSLFILRQEYISTLEDGGNNKEEIRRQIEQAVSQSAQTKILIEVHIIRLIEDIIEKGNPEKLVQFARYQNSEGQTPLMLLLKKYPQHGAKLNYAIVQHLLPASDIFATDAQKRTAFHYACMYYNPSSSLDIVCKLVEAIKQNKTGKDNPFLAGLGPDANSNSFLHHFIAVIDSDSVISTFLCKMIAEMPYQLLVALVHANNQDETIFFLLDSKAKHFESSINLLCNFMLQPDVKTRLVKIIQKKVQDVVANIAGRYTLFGPRGRDPLVELIRNLVTEKEQKQQIKIYKRILQIMEWRHAFRFNLVGQSEGDESIELNIFAPFDELIRQDCSVIDIPDVGGMLAHEALVMMLLEASQSIQIDFITSGAFAFYEANTPYTITLTWHIIQEFVTDTREFAAKVRATKYSSLLEFLPPIQWKDDPCGKLFIEYAIDLMDLPLIQFLATFKVGKDKKLTAETDIDPKRVLDIACNLAAVVHPETKEFIIGREYILKYFQLLLVEMRWKISDKRGSPRSDLNVLYLPVSLNYYDLMELFFNNLAQDEEVLQEMMLHCSSMCSGRTAYQVARKKTAELAGDPEKLEENIKIYELFEQWADQLGIALVGRDVGDQTEPPTQATSAPQFTLTM